MKITRLTRGGLQGVKNMALVTKATRGGVGTNNWTSPSNATGDEGTYATAAPAKNNSVIGDWDFAAFSDAEIPIGATINSVVIRSQYKVSTQASIASLGVQAGNNGSYDTEETHATEPLSDTNFDITYNTPPSETDLKTAGRLVARIRAIRGNDNDAVTFSLDYIELRVTYTVAYTIAAAQGSYAISGQSANFSRTLKVIASQGSYVISGQSVGLLVGRKIQAGQGSYSVGGQDANFTRTYRADAQQGTYTLSGQDVGLITGRKLTLEQGNFTITGQDVGLSYAGGGGGAGGSTKRKEFIVRTKPAVPLPFREDEEAVRRVEEMNRVISDFSPTPVKQVDIQRVISPIMEKKVFVNKMQQAKRDMVVQRQRAQNLSSFKRKLR